MGGVNSLKGPIELVESPGHRLPHDDLFEELEARVAVVIVREVCDGCVTPEGDR